MEEECKKKAQTKRGFGGVWEKYAAGRLAAAGLKILKLNFRCKSGEIDIIARDGDYLVFVEVKCRRSRRLGNPLESVTAYKQNKIRRVAGFFLLRYGFGEATPCRFDVYGIEAASGGNAAKEYWIKDAF